MPQPEPRDNSGDDVVVFMAIPVVIIFTVAALGFIGYFYHPAWVLLNSIMNRLGGTH